MICPALWPKGELWPRRLKFPKDVARKLIESYREHGDPLPESLRPLNKATAELTIPVGA